MDSFDTSATNQIIVLLEKRLERPLTSSETETFKLPRSGMAYEMIIGTIESSTVSQLENYVQSVVDEYKKHTT
ncbi:MAG TPA: hypothetical protein PKL31_10480 [Fulvivirga sp.]|nr:hypothetical protein [Fulvivirga sp.]